MINQNSSDEFAQYASMTGTSSLVPRTQSFISRGVGFSNIQIRSGVNGFSVAPMRTVVTVVTAAIPLPTPLWKRKLFEKRGSKRMGRRVKKLGCTPYIVGAAVINVFTVLCFLFTMGPALSTTLIDCLTALFWAYCVRSCVLTRTAGTNAELLDDPALYNFLEVLHLWSVGLTWTVTCIIAWLSISAYLWGELAPSGHAYMAIFAILAASANKWLVIVNEMYLNTKEA